ncbi:MAG: LOG family protein [Ignavibacteria bacterium]|nr:LOG family protein [Ignavibacteria bacterium]
MEKIITSFGSAFISINETLYKQIEEIGKICAISGYSVCSGGFNGSMEAISKGARNVKSNVIGVTVKGWKNTPNSYLNKIIETENLFERIMKLINLGSAYIIFKGGTGTLLELSAVFELMNKGVINEKPVIFYTNFWKSIVELLKSDSEKLKGIIDKNVHFVNTPEEIKAII